MSRDRHDDRWHAAAQVSISTAVFCKQAVDNPAIVRSAINEQATRQSNGDEEMVGDKTYRLSSQAFSWTGNTIHSYGDGQVRQMKPTDSPATTSSGQVALSKMDRWER